jgi:hypothetical protein
MSRTSAEHERFVDRQGAWLRSALRVCPETLNRIAKFSEHEPNGCEAQECEPLSIEILPILGESSAAIEPGDGAFDDPALGQHRKSFNLIGALDDFGFEVRQDFREGGGEFRPLIAGVGKQLFQERVHAVQSRKKQNAAVAILNIGRMNDGVEQEA